MSAHVAHTGIKARLPIRSSIELDTAFRAIDQLITGQDRLCRLLGLGAHHAACHILPGLLKPAHSSIPGPQLIDVTTAIRTAGLIAAGALAWHESVAAETSRILGCGAEGWLAWSFLDGSPLPLWLVPGMPPEEIHRCALSNVRA